MSPPIRCSSLSRIRRRSRKSPRARSSITRSIAEIAKVTPAALTACRSTGARKRLAREARQLLDAEQPLARDGGGIGKSMRSAMVGAARETSSTAPSRMKTGVGPSSSSKRPASVASAASSGSIAAVERHENCRTPDEVLVALPIVARQLLVSSFYVGARVADSRGENHELWHDAEAK